MESEITKLSSSNHRKNKNDDDSSGVVQTHESLSVNTLLETSTNDCKETYLSRISYLKCYYTNATSLNNKFFEFIEEL